MAPRADRGPVTREDAFRTVVAFDGSFRRYYTRDSVTPSAIATVVTVAALCDGAFRIAADNPDGLDWLLIAGLLAAAAIAGVVGSRAALAGVYASDTEVAVVSPFRTYRHEWGDVVGFELTAAGRHPCVGVVHLRDGEPIVVLGIRGAKGWLREDTARAQAVIDDLNDRMMKARAAS